MDKVIIGARLSRRRSTSLKRKCACTPCEEVLAARPPCCSIGLIDQSRPSDRHRASAAGRAHPLWGWRHPTSATAPSATSPVQCATTASAPSGGTGRKRLGVPRHLSVRTVTPGASALAKSPSDARRARALREPPHTTGGRRAPGAQWAAILRRSQPIRAMRASARFVRWRIMVSESPWESTRTPPQREARPAPTETGQSGPRQDSEPPETSQA